MSAGRWGLVSLVLAGGGCGGATNGYSITIVKPVADLVAANGAATLQIHVSGPPSDAGLPDGLCVDVGVTLGHIDCVGCVTPGDGDVPGAARQAFLPVPYSGDLFASYVIVAPGEETVTALLYGSTDCTAPSGRPLAEDGKAFVIAAPDQASAPVDLWRSLGDLGGGDAAHGGP